MVRVRRLVGHVIQEIDWIGQDVVWEVVFTAAGVVDFGPRLAWKPDLCRLEDGEAHVGALDGATEGRPDLRGPAVGRLRLPELRPLAGQAGPPIKRRRRSPFRGLIHAAHQPPFLIEQATKAAKQFHRRKKIASTDCRST